MSRDTDGIILETDGLTVGYRDGHDTRPILRGLNLRLRRGELVSILGANGIGKSTLLRTISGVQPPLTGHVRIGGRDLASCQPRELSRMVSIVYTDRTMAGGLTVRELVSLGRQPYTGFFGRLGADDIAIVDEALRSVGITGKSDSYVATLSDGERQKTMIARALAQDTPLIILDEPTAFLDVASRIETMQLLSRLTRDSGKTVLLSSHDVSQSLLLSNRLWLLMPDGTMADGIPASLIADGCLDRLFSDRDIVFDPALHDFRPRR
ncbi:MAG: ABC transporter ATP-binding protein [Pseudoflavonifractor sp.]|nr:ABC transporter ATP-binding protein [Pseudoflavonifractor sp.]